MKYQQVVIFTACFVFCKCKVSFDMYLKCTKCLGLFEHLIANHLLIVHIYICFILL